jgi:hypothetical protein
MNIAQLTQNIAAVGAAGMIATILAHLPFMPPKYAEFFTRFGLTTQKFSVNQKSDKQEKL